MNARKYCAFCDEHPELTPDFLALLTQNGVPPHKLLLKEGSVCLLMRNLSVRKCLVKNARVIVRRLHHRFVEIQVINNHTGQLDETHCIPRIQFEFTPSHSGWTVMHFQLPLRLAYATTFNGCVGLTLNHTVLTHGQLYTALSRVRQRQDSRVLFEVQCEENRTTNIVHRPLLL